jgi:uncharacterized protein (TIGR03032 family)
MRAEAARFGGAIDGKRGVPDIRYDRFTRICRRPAGGDMLAGCRKQLTRLQRVELGPREPSLGLVNRLSHGAYLLADGGDLMARDDSKGKAKARRVAATGDPESASNMQAPGRIVKQSDDLSGKPGMPGPEQESPGTAGVTAPREFKYEASESLVDILGEVHASLLVSTYQASRLVAVGVSEGALNVTLHTFERAMGLAVAPDRIAVGSGPQIFFLQSAPHFAPRLAPPGKFDSCFLARSSHVTGEIHSHELGFAGVQLWFVNTLFSCLCTLHPNMSFLPQWKPPFISALAMDDRCHLNGLAMADGRPRYATALGQTDTPHGWRPGKANGGCLIDIPASATIASGFSMPHSPRVHQGKLWLLDSGTGRLVTVDPRSGASETVAVLPGYTRGLSFAGAYAFVGLCKIRETAQFGEVPIAADRDRLKCGVAVVEPASGRLAALLDFTAGINEIFAVEVLPGTRCPAISGPFVVKDETQPIYSMPEDWLPQPSAPNRASRGV